MKIFTIYTDGGARGNPGPAGAGVVIATKEGEVIKTAKKSLGVATNNEAEYAAILLAISEIKKLVPKDEREKVELRFHTDSELIVRQLLGEYQIKEERLFPYFISIWNTKIADFPNMRFEHIPREKNHGADLLANEAMDAEQKTLL